MAIQGLQNTTTFDTPTGRRPQNYREMILRLYPNGGGMQKAPLTALTAVMRSESTNDPVYHWFTKQMQDRRFKLNANLAATNSQTTENITIDATVADAYGLKTGDLLYVEMTGEIMRVAADPSATTTVSVVRGFTVLTPTAQTAVNIAAGTTNPFLKVIGSAFPEGSAAPAAISWNPVENFNQTQIFRCAYGMTGTAQETKTRTGNEWAESKREALEVFTMDMEMGFVFGKKVTTIGSNGHPLRMTSGLVEQLPANRIYTPGAGTIDANWLDKISEDIFRYGATEKLAFCGSSFMTQIGKMVRLSSQGQYQIDKPVSEYGMGGFQRLLTPHGTLVLKIHPLFSQMTGSAGNYTAWANNALILDMQYIKYKYMQNRDVKHVDNMQIPGLDGQLAGFIGECGLEMHFPTAHALIQGVSNASAPA